MRKKAFLQALLVVGGVLLALSRPACGDPVIPPAMAPLLHDDKDELLGRTFVPSPDQKVGEVRLLRRGDAEVVQTLLYTKILRRVVGEIRKKELASWPDGSDGHADAEHYADALAQAQEEIWSRLPKFERGADPRQKLLIEFILSAKVAAVLLAEYDMEEGSNEVRAKARRPLAWLEPSRRYVQHNMQLIVLDSFKLTPAELGGIFAKMPSVGTPPDLVPGPAPTATTPPQ